MRIKCGKEYLEVSTTAESTIGQIRTELLDRLHYSSVKIVLSGKVLSDDNLLINSIPGGSNAKLVAIVSDPIKEIAVDPTLRIINDLDSNSYNKFHGNGQNNGQINSNYNNSINVKYKFERIETLPNLPNEEKAKDILLQLSNDPGVLAVMNKHKWSVGCLAELYPEGSVGVSDVCVMGLNQNHGQKILLRLRTDDLKGFRKILSIRKVLFHELAHNEHSEHNDKFYVLMRQIEREVEELDWKSTKGNLLGGANRANDYLYYNNGSASDGKYAYQANTPAVQKLGGSDSVLTKFIPAKYLAGTAAVMRLSAEEKEIEDNCGSRTNGSVETVCPDNDIVTREDNADSELILSKAEDQQIYDPMQIVSDSNQTDRSINENSDTRANIFDAKNNDQHHLNQHIFENSTEEILSERENALILSQVDEVIAFSLGAEASTPIEKLLAVRDALESVVSPNVRTPSAAFIKYLKLIQKIMGNVKVKNFVHTYLFYTICVLIRCTSDRMV